MAFDLTDEELQATREMNKTAWQSEIDKWSKEYLIERYKDLVEIEKEHKKENGELREKLNNEIENYKVLSLDIAQACVDLGLPEDTIIADELVLEINKRYISKDKIRKLQEKYKNKIERLESKKIWNEPVDTINKNRYTNYFNVYEELLQEGDDK